MKRFKLCKVCSPSARRHESFKMCPRCRKKAKGYQSRGGKNSSLEAKLRASRAGVLARSKSALKLTFRGETLPVSEWAKRTGIAKRRIWRGLAARKTPEQIFKGAEFLPSSLNQ